jgi:hypothetical protein
MQDIEIGKISTVVSEFDDGRSDTSLPVPNMNKEMFEVIVTSAHDPSMLVGLTGVEDKQGGCMKRVGRVEHFNRVRLLWP